MQRERKKRGRGKDVVYDPEPIHFYLLDVIQIRSMTQTRGATLRKAFKVQRSYRDENSV
jgi:hypothetical protein